MSNSQQRIYGLDVYRAIAIILVVHTHGRYLLQGSILENMPWIKLIDGVELFFVLSGFLIGGILIRSITSSSYRFSLQQLIHFWKRRWFRTLPLYYVILLANVAFAYYGLNADKIDEFSWKFIFFIHNFNSSFHSFFWESWSLSIEEWFYIIFPSILLCLLRFRASKSSILAAILLLIILPLIYRVYLFDPNLTGSVWDVSVRKVVIVRLDSIIYGVLAAYIKHYYPRFWTWNVWLYFMLGCALMFLIAYIPRQASDFWTQSFYLNGTSIAAMFMLPLASSIQNFKSVIGQWLTHISLISYSMYLINLALISELIKKHVVIHSPTEGCMWYAIYWVLVIVIGSGLYRYIELPFLKLRDRF